MAEADEDTVPSFRKILDAMADLVLVKGARSKLVWANRAFRELYGMSNEALQDLVDADHADPDDTIQYVRDDHRVYTTGETLDIPSEPITDTGGKVAYYRTVKSALRNEAGEVTHTVGVSRLIEASDNARAIRRERKDGLTELRALISSIPIPMIMCDASLRVIEQSDAWTTFAGFTADPKDAFDTAYDSVLSVSEPMRNVILQDGEVRQEGLTAYPRGSSPKTVNVQIRAWRLPDGAVGGATLVVLDVTEATRDRVRLTRLNDELQQFSYRASHDLKGPLRTAIGFLGLVGEHLKENEVAQAINLLGRVQFRLQSLSGLVEDLLELARADLKAAEIQAVSLPKVLAASLEKARQQTERAVDSKFELAVESLVSDPTRLTQVLTNLMANAIKFASSAPARVEVRSGQAERHVWLEVTDHGIGFDRPEVAFQSFQRGHNAADIPGTGLGLAIVRKHLEHLGGQIWIESAHNPTTLHITLPMKEG